MQMPALTPLHTSINKLKQPSEKLKKQKKKK